MAEDSGKSKKSSGSLDKKLGFPDYSSPSSSDYFYKQHTNTKNWGDPSHVPTPTVPIGIQSFPNFYPQPEQLGHAIMHAERFSGNERWLPPTQPSLNMYEDDRKHKDMEQGTQRCREKIIQKVKETTEQAVSKHFEESLRLAKEKQMKKLKLNSIPSTIEVNPSYGRPIYGAATMSPQVQIPPTHSSSLYKPVDYDHAARRPKPMTAPPPLLQQQQFSESVIVQNSNFPKKPKLVSTAAYNHPYLNEQHFPVRQDVKLIETRVDSGLGHKQPTVLMSNQLYYRQLENNGGVHFVGDLSDSRPPLSTSNSSIISTHHTIVSQSPLKSSLPPPPAHSLYSAPSISSLLPNIDATNSKTVECLPKDSIDFSFQTQPLDLGVTSSRKMDEAPKSHDILNILAKDSLNPDIQFIDNQSNVKEVNNMKEEIEADLVLSSTEKNFTLSDIFVNAKVEIKEEIVVRAPRHLKKAWLKRHTGEDVKTNLTESVSDPQIHDETKLSNYDKIVEVKVEKEVSQVKLEPEYSSEKNEKDRDETIIVTDISNIKTTEVSDKENTSSKDSDTNTSSTYSESTAEDSLKKKKTKENLKRDRQLNGQSVEKKKKKMDGGTSTPRNMFSRPPISRLKKTGESFLQDGPCFEVCPKLTKCRECRWTANQRSKNTSNIFCRFYAFRKLRYTKGGLLAIAGFSDPHKDPKTEDLKLWITNSEPQTQLDLQMSRFILAQVADQFCNLYTQEQEANEIHFSEDNTIAWKRVVQGVREMCDVCQTTLFNNHFSCSKCGFVVCLDCYKARKNHDLKIWTEVDKDRDEYYWLLCNNKSIHEQEKLMLTQIIAGDALQQLAQKIHEVRSLWNIPQHCECSFKTEKEKSMTEKDVKTIRELLESQPNCLFKDKKTNQRASCGDSDDSDEDSDSDRSTNEVNEKSSALRDLLIYEDNSLPIQSTTVTTKPLDSEKSSKTQALEEDFVKTSTELHHYVSKSKRNLTFLPTRIMTLVQSRTMYPDVPHQWLCDGKLLRLLDPSHSGNYKIFQEQWKRGQPVIVSSVNKRLKGDLWHPNTFSSEFGEEKFDLINCISGNLLPNQPLKKFWDGFDNISKRLKDDKGTPMLLKLKDWPPSDDFSEVLPSRFNDFMQALPLSEYTQRTGRLNLASRFPTFFVRPDLGPKMYCAYGSALHETKGTTNLHLDISDAVNIMAYVGVPKDIDYEENVKEAYRAIDDADCDILTRRRVREKCELPGALWHIYSPKDADKIRDLLNKVAIEKGVRLQPHHDPIHDQSHYLDKGLRSRLYAEYGVEGYPIAQCLGDAVFIPAGAPHQVRNLHNCIKVAEDFVSPENVSHCFHLTQEFRNLSTTHTNHEDKLQIKNIIYHAVKDAVSYLTNLYKEKNLDSTDQFLLNTKKSDESEADKINIKI